MINFKYIYKSLTGIIAIAGLTLSGCSNDKLNVSSTNNGQYDISAIPVALTVNSNNKAKNEFIEFRDELNTELFLTTTKEVTQTTDVEFYYNEELLTRYNFVNGTKYVAYNPELVTFQNEGVVTFEANSKKSAALQLSIVTSEDNDVDVTYVIPVSAKSNEDSNNQVVKIDKSTDYFIFVRDLTSLPDATKPPYTKIVNDKEVFWKEATKVISCMEVNDTNPLNNLNFTLKSSGKPLVDIVVLFSGNINFNAETGRVFNHNNPNVQHLLDNHLKYLKPLQDRGMKVVLGILGNHDRAGVTNLSDETARAFAQELKAVADAYNLDGFFWDDEYSKPMRPTPPGFVSYNNSSRLFYEVKKAMPDKLNMTYLWGGLYNASEIDGMRPKDFIDYAVSDYGAGPGSGYGSDFTDLQKSPYSQEYNLGRNMITNSSTIAGFKQYGAHMIFAMDPFRGNRSRQISSMQAIAKGLYDDELVVDKNYFPKDW